MTRKIQNVVVVGGGTAGWMAAALMARMLRAASPINITLIESEDIATVGVGEATVPIIQAFNGVLGIDEREFLRHTYGTYKLGIEFRNWVREGSTHFHFFGDFGDAIAGIAPHHHWLKLRSLGDTTPLSSYSLPYSAAQSSRFVPPDPRFSAAAYKYAYHFDAALYANYLRRYAESLGVKRINARVTNVKLQAENGFIESVMLDTDEHISGDLFVDCSGFNGLLIEQALHAGFDDWTKWLPCDRAVVIASGRRAVLPPYTVSTAREAGWQWSIPLQHRTGNGYVYCSDYVSDDHAHATLTTNLDGDALTESRLLKFTTGRRRVSWKRNCVAIGLAAGFMEPLESTSIQLIQTAIVRLIDLWPDQDFDPTIINEYNRVTANEYERVRDFIILHYHATQRNDSAFWRDCRSMLLPDTLQHKVDVFNATGKVPLISEESYQEPSWVSIFLGQEMFPKRYDPVADQLSLETLRRGMQQRRERVNQLVKSMPTHDQFISEYCKESVEYQ